MINGIGDGISDFLDDTTFFISGAMSKTNPYAGRTRNARLIWTVKQVTATGLEPNSLLLSVMMVDGELEFNHGSNYWRPITYGEDTMIGSKIAARGDAYEVYFTEPLVDDILDFPASLYLYQL